MFYHFNFKELSDTEINEAYAIIDKARDLRVLGLTIDEKKVLINSLEEFGVFKKLIDDCKDCLDYEIIDRLCFGGLAIGQEMTERFHKNYLENKI